MEADSIINSIFEESIAGSKVLNPAAKTFLPFKCILCIYHVMRFKKNKAKVQVSLDSSSEINAMIPAYAVRLGFKVKPINVKA